MPAGLVIVERRPQPLSELCELRLRINRCLRQRVAGDPAFPAQENRRSGDHQETDKPRRAIRQFEFQKKVRDGDDTQRHRASGRQTTHADELALENRPLLHIPNASFQLTPGHIGGDALG